MAAYNGYSGFRPPLAVHQVNGIWSDFWQTEFVSCSRCGPIGSFSYWETEPPLGDPDGDFPSQRFNLDHEAYWNNKDGIYPDTVDYWLRPDPKPFEPEISYIFQNDTDEELILALQYIEFHSKLASEIAAILTGP